MNKLRVDSKGHSLWRGEHERKDGRYEYKYTDRNGKRQSVYATSIKQLRLLEAKIAGKERINILCGACAVTLNEQFELWIASKMNLRYNTRIDYCYMYDTYVRNSLGKMEIEEITTFDIKSHYLSLQLNTGLTSETIVHLQNIIFQIFQSAKDNNQILSNPAERAAKEFKRKHSKHTTTKKGMNKKQAEAFLKFLLGDAELRRWYPVFCVMINTGLRLGELASLRWCDVNFEKGYIDVNHSVAYCNRGKGKSFYQIVPPKTEAGYRTIPFSAEVKEALLREKTRQMQEGITCDINIDGYTDFVFLNKLGMIFTQSPLNRALRRAVLKYNANPIKDNKGADIIIPHLSNHSLRHTYACILCESNVNIKVMQKLLGHSDIQTTMMIYTEISQEFIMEEYMKKVVGE